MINNILVSFSYFFKGILFGVPSIVLLAKESIRLGAFEHMFYVKGLGGKAIVTVLLHGLLELTAIIITCGAGVVMGKSFYLPVRKSGRCTTPGSKRGYKDRCRPCANLCCGRIYRGLYYPLLQNAIIHEPVYSFCMRPFYHLVLHLLSY
jgi:hypothetical protein